MKKSVPSKDSYLYEDVPVLRNIPGIKDEQKLSEFEGDVTRVSMSIVYATEFRKFNTSTLKEIHKLIFGPIYDWAGEFRDIQIIKPEPVLGGDTVRYTYPGKIKKELDAASKRIAKLKQTQDKRNLVLDLVRITAHIWQIHPFREGNTRTVIAFAVLLAQSLGIEMDYELLKQNASYVRNALVWASQGIYSKMEYLERIFCDAAGVLADVGSSKMEWANYAFIEGYKVADYKETPHQYDDKNKKSEK